MAKTYVRVDDRLIHGQTIVAWCPTLSIKEIIAIDDDSAKKSDVEVDYENGRAIHVYHTYRHNGGSQADSGIREHR